HGAQENFHLHRPSISPIDPKARPEKKAIDASLCRREATGHREQSKKRSPMGERDQRLLYGPCLLLEGVRRLEQGMHAAAALVLRPPKGHQPIRALSLRAWPAAAIDAFPQLPAAEVPRPRRKAPGPSQARYQGPLDALPDCVCH